VLGFLIEQLFMSASEKDVKMKFLSKVVYQNSKTLRACEYQIRTMRRQFGDNDPRLTYMNQHFSIIKRGFSEINDALASLSKAIEKASSDRSFIFKKSFSEQSRLEGEMLNVVLDYGCQDSEDNPFPSPFTGGDIVMFPAGEWGPTENTRKEQARQNRKLYEQRLARKKESIVYYYNALKPFDVCVHSL
jgi:hypothetical protein